MVRLFVLVLCVVFTMCSFASFAETSTAAAPDVEAVTDTMSAEELVKVVVEEEEVSEQEVEALVKIEGIEELEAEQNSVISEVYDVTEINAENALVVLTAIKKYLTVRDKYYRNVLLKLRVISSLENKTLAKKAIVRFERMFERQKELDRKIHHKIERVLKYIKSHGNKLSKNQRVALRTQLKPVLTKYYKHRQLIIHIHNTIKKLKLALHKEQVVKLRQFAAQLEKAKKFNAALKLYEEALKNGDSDREMYRKIGDINKRIGKKSPGIYVGKKRVQTRVEPLIRKGTTLIPLRAVSESLEADVKWDGKTKTVTITKGDKVIELKLRSSVIKVNGVEKTISQPADIISGTTIVPLRVVSETLDAKVGYDNETKIITVEDNFTAPEGTIDVGEAAGSGLISGEEVVTDVTGEQAAEELLAGEEN